MSERRRHGICGCAHNNNDLGTIPVYSDLLTQTDISTTSRPAYGIARSIAEGTIAFSFRADQICGYDALFSKDASGYGTGGHLTAWVTEGGDVKIRFQSDSSEIWLKAQDVVEAGTEHDFAFTFGDDGIFLFIDGVEVAADEEFQSDWLGNEEYLMIGANGWGSPSGEVGWTNDHFDGEIFDFRILDDQLSADQVGDSLFA